MHAGRIGQWLWICIALLMSGCGEAVERGQNVPLDQVPPTVMQVAKQKLPQVKFESAWKEKEDGEDAYEVRGREQNGKIRDVKVSASGKVLEVD